MIFLYSIDAFTFISSPRCSQFPPYETGFLSKQAHAITLLPRIVTSLLIQEIKLKLIFLQNSILIYLKQKILSKYQTSNLMFQKDSNNST